MTCRVNPFILMSDPRLPSIIKAAKKLPIRSTLIYRHFGDPNAASIAKDLRQICFQRHTQFLIGKDVGLAIQVGADGVHLPQVDLMAASLWRRRCPDWIITCAVHGQASLAAAQHHPLDAVILSPIFKSQSPSAKAPLGINLFKSMCNGSARSVIALGGINPQTAQKLHGCGAAGLAGVSKILD